MAVKWEEWGGERLTVEVTGDMWRHGTVNVTSGGIKRKVGEGMSGMGR